MRYVKLLDGGLVDNFGLSGFTIALLSATRPYEPLTPQQAARIRRVMFLIVDSGRGPSGDWSQQLAGPTGVDLVMATADTATEASTRASYTAFVSTMNDWVAKRPPLALRPVGGRAAAPRASAPTGAATT